LSTIAFFFLFVEFGKEKCYQYRESHPTKENTRYNSDQWTWGVFFYSIAFPMTIVNYYLYVVGIGNETSLKQDILINIAT
jgi:hypothetical protein